MTSSFTNDDGNFMNSFATLQIDYGGGDNLLLLLPDQICNCFIQVDGNGIFQALLFAKTIVIIVKFYNRGAHYDKPR